MPPTPEVRTGAGMGIALLRAVLLLSLVAVSLYLVPRVSALIAMPGRLDEALAHARAYNPRLPKMAAQDNTSTAELASLDRIDVSLARVQASDREVADELSGLVGQIRGDVQVVLNRTNVRVGSLVGSLDALTLALEDLEHPVSEARDAVSTDRARLARTIRIAEATAHHVHEARLAAEEAADDVSGPTGSRSK